MLNFSAIYSIIAFRIKEFLQEYHYSLLAPLTTNLLFILVFITVENYYSLSMDSGSFVEFIAPGLIINVYLEKYLFTKLTQKLTPIGNKLSLKSYLVV